MKRELPCEICGKPVQIQKDRFLAMVKANHQLHCEQCRRFVRPGVARVSQLPSEQEVPKLGLARKCRRGAKRKGALASMPLARCGDRGYGDGVGTDE